MPIKSLYRSLLRETSKLPYGYLRAFFRFKYRDDVDSAVRAIENGKKSTPVKLKRLNLEIRRIRAANSGDKKSLSRLLDLAYGRKGKLRRELLEPFLRQPTTDLPPPIIPGVEKSRPPVFTKELVALLISPISRTSASGKALSCAVLDTPPSIASRVNPSPEEARLLGPLSKRREVNARWRYFKLESSRVQVPLQVSVTHVDRDTGAVTALSGSDQTQKMQELGLTGAGLQDSGLLEALESISGAPHQYIRTRRERKSVQNQTENARTTAADVAAPLLPTKLLRRAHRKLLGSIPLLTYYHKTITKDGERQSYGAYEITLPKPNVSLNRTLAQQLPLIDDRNMAWIRHAGEIGGQKKSKSRRYTKGRHNKL